MKRYSNEGETPLKFHKLFHYLIIPYTCLSGFLSVLDYAFYLPALDIGSWVDFGYTAAVVILTAIIFLGFYSFSGYAWYCLMGYLGLRASMDLVGLVLTFLFLPEELLVNAIAVLIDILILLPIALYYIKRKPLFFPQKHSAAPSFEPVEPPLAADQSSAAVMNFCPNCGKALKPDYAFCPNCGTPRG